MSEHAQRYWDECLKQMSAAGTVLETSVVADSPDTAVDAADYLLMTLSSAYLLTARGDPGHPEFIPLVNHVYPYGAANPDATYYYAALSDRGTYRVLGHRNTTSWVDFMTGRDFWGFAEEPGPSFGSTQIDRMQIAADGTFEILLSATRPAGHSGNWIELKPGANYLLIRQFAYTTDEVDVRMGIERLDPVPVFPCDRAAARKRIDDTLRTLRYSSRHWPSFLVRQRLREEGFVNRLRVANYGETGEVYGQIYHQGLYEVGEDEALLLEVRVPKVCRYWNIQLSDRLWRTLEQMHRQVSLNGDRDRADADGVVRLVVSHRDPGVENWVDACGVTEGDLIMRWQYVDAEPKPVIHRMPFAALAERLPPGTRRVTPEQRARALRERAMAMQLRRRW